MNLEELRAPLSHRAQLQRYEEGRGPQTRGFARGAEDLLIPGRLGGVLIVYFNNTATGDFRKVK